MKFGDDSTADVFLTLSSDETLGPLKLHSSVLSRSEFFKAQLSERWASHEKPAEIQLKVSKDPVMYIKFLELLYAPEKRRHLCSLEEALGILEVAAQLLCEEVISYCMNYVEAIPWTCEEEEAIRLCISSLNLRPSPDLALKLSGSFCAADEVQNMLHQLLLSADHTDIDKHVADIMLSNVQDPEFAVVFQNVLVQDLHRNIRNLKRSLETLTCKNPKTDCFDDKYGKLRWLLDQFQKLNITGVAIKILAEDNELAELMFENRWRHHHNSTDSFLQYLDRLYGDLCDGKVVLPRAVRMALVTSWFEFRTSAHLDRDRNWLAYMVKSLPMRDQSKIFNVWIHYGHNFEDPLIEVFLSWCRKIKEVTSQNQNAVEDGFNNVNASK